AKNAARADGPGVMVLPGLGVALELEVAGSDRNIAPFGHVMSGKGLDAEIRAGARLGRRLSGRLGRREEPRRKSAKRHREPAPALQPHSVYLGTIVLHRIRQRLS